MKHLILFICLNAFLGMAFAETDTTAETKPAAPEMEQVSTTEKASEPKPEKVIEPKPEPKPEKVAEPKPEPAKEKVSDVEVVSTPETASEISALAGVKYVCDESRFYTFYEPGTNPDHLCELDAGHTEQPADWYALNNSSFCKEKLEELISQYNCTQEN